MIRCVDPTQIGMPISTNRGTSEPRLTAFEPPSRCDCRPNPTSLVAASQACSSMATGEACPARKHPVSCYGAAPCPRCINWLIGLEPAVELPCTVSTLPSIYFSTHGCTDPSVRETYGRRPVPLTGRTTIPKSLDVSILYPNRQNRYISYRATRQRLLLESSGRCNRTRPIT
ncbi:hypothetical protein LY76DRAFT_209161 [Colletotrichum caudatum]|nr:hypothetical protein LY76DRAFT_209161 [Colletotrichum caudatum]